MNDEMRAMAMVADQLLGKSEVALETPKTSAQRKREVVAPKTSRASTRRVLLAIKLVEERAESAGIGGVHWHALLTSYRANIWSVSSRRDHDDPPINPQFLRRQVPDDTSRLLLSEALRVLNVEFRDGRNYNPADHLTEGIVSCVGRFNKTGATSDARNEAERILIEHGYLSAPRGKVTTPGTKAWIKAKVVRPLKSRVSEGTFNTILKGLRQSGQGSKPQ